MVRALQADGRLAWKQVRTGQHFDHKMTDAFFDELGIPTPDVHFNSGGTGMPEEIHRVVTDAIGDWVLAKRRNKLSRNCTWSCSSADRHTM